MFQATLELTRTAATLRSLRVTASGHGVIISPVATWPWPSATSNRKGSAT